MGRHAKKFNNYDSRDPFIARYAGNIYGKHARPMTEHSARQRILSFTEEDLI